MQAFSLIVEAFFGISGDTESCMKISSDLWSSNPWKLLRAFWKWQLFSAYMYFQIFLFVSDWRRVCVSKTCQFLSSISSEQVRYPCLPYFSSRKVSSIKVKTSKAKQHLGILICTFTTQMPWRWYILRLQLFKICPFGCISGWRVQLLTCSAIITITFLR